MSAGLPGQIFREGRVSVCSWLGITGLAGRRARVVRILGDAQVSRPGAWQSSLGLAAGVRQKGRVEAGGLGPPGGTECIQV